MKNNDSTQKLYAITGGPGSGKTTLLNELGKKGFMIASEEGRRIIKEQIEFSGDGLPWLNKELFAQLMFDASVKTHQQMLEMAGSKPIFFDRGILDTIGYLKMEDIPIPKEMEMMAREMSYNRNVFILPPWKEIYENDSERKQTLEIAIATFECMYETYREYGYSIIEVPKGTIEQRVQFIINEIDAD